MLTVDAHPLLDARAFITRFPAPLGELSGAAFDALTALLSGDADAPLSSDDHIRKTVRDLLRHGGFKPTGRSKPSAEYLRKAADTGRLQPINPAVDVGNAVSLHSGLPISVVALDKLKGPLRLAIAEPGASYVFNRSGQIIDVGRLLCLFDAEGPCANAVKDAQRSKTDEHTRATLSIIWGASALAGRSDAALAWYHQILGSVGASVELITAAPVSGE